jgi:hypothetical protein
LNALFDSELAKICAFVADMRGGKDGNSHRIGEFCGAKTAGRTRAATELAQTRQECAMHSPLHEFRQCMAGMWEAVAGKRKEVTSTEEKTKGSKEQKNR